MRRVKMRTRFVMSAFQWDGELVEGFQRLMVGRDEFGNPGYNLEIPQPDGGAEYAVIGDWVVKGWFGNEWVFKGDDAAFHAMSEVVEEL